MDADTAHRFWLGKVNVTVALARGQMTLAAASKILKLVAAVKPVQARYERAASRRAQEGAGQAERYLLPLLERHVDGSKWCPRCRRC